MLVAGIVISAVAMFLGLITKLPQGGGGLASNLIALTFFLPAPPLPPLPLQKRVLFDLETAIAENQLYYLSNPVVTSNGTYGPMPRPLWKLPSSPADNATFTFPTFAFSFPDELIKFWESIGAAIMVFMALCLPCLVIKKMNILAKTGPALQAASRPIVTRFGKLVAQIEPLSPLLEDLRIIISERDQAFANLWIVIKQAQEAEKEAAEKDEKNEKVIKGLCAERNKALKELEQEKEKVAKVEEGRKKEVDGLRGETSSLMATLEEKKKSEVDGLREEMSRQAKAWAEKVAKLGEEKKKEVDKLQEEAAGQIKIWTEKEKKWEEGRRDDKQRHNEAIDGLKMSRERETESWQKQVGDLERVKKGAKEAFGAQLKKMVERMKKEKEGWAKEKEAWKEEMAKEKEEWEGKRTMEEKSWAKANDRAQKRIDNLEVENQGLKDKEAERQKQAAEAEAVIKTAEAEQENWQKHAEEDAKKSIAKLEKEVLNGRKLIEDLQADKRRDRQLLLELRAQLVRPTHALPPHHMNPFRFGGAAPHPLMGVPGPSALNPPSGFTPHTATPLPSPLPSPRPTVRLPPRPPPNTV